MRLFGRRDIQDAVADHLRGRPDLAGKVVIDIPAGGGQMSRLLGERGATVEPFDLFPGFFKAEGMICRKANLNHELPIPDAHADLVLCMEGIEHLPNQLGVLREFNRVLKPGGRLILTTPNDSSLRAKLSRLFIESELYNRLAPSEFDAVWLTEGDEMYFGHVFLIGIQRLRMLARISGLRIARIHPVRASQSAVLLGVLLPLVALVNLHAYWRSVRRHPPEDRAFGRAVYGEMVRLNLNRQVLFGRSLFIEMVKECERDEAATAFRRSIASPGPPGPSASVHGHV